MMHNFISRLLFIAFIILLPVSCKHTRVPSGTTPFQTTVRHPEWSKNAVLYEVNIRQYTPEGTFRAFEKHLPRLKALGVDILWLMPIYPIGEKNRKGPLGSYYSIRNYTKVNPAYGSPEDLKHLVNTAHAMGFHVLFDWVANHTAWDHSWTKEHPEWYEHDSTGHFVSPYDWTDVIQLNYSNHDLWKAMIGSMKYWITEMDIDGYRCDYPGHIPVAFWDSARTVLEKIKPVFMLAEDEAHPLLLEHAFDMNYAWELMHLTEHIAQGKEKASALNAYFTRQKELYPPQAYRLNCITNHDENSWSGTVFERYGDAARVFAMLSFTVPGMPLIYSGQEAGLDKRLRFFDKDTIPWTDTLTWSPFYRKLINLKHTHSPLWNGSWGNEIEILNNDQPDKVFSFARGNKKERVIIIANLSPGKVDVHITGLDTAAKYQDLLTRKSFKPGDEGSVSLLPWNYMILLHSTD